MKTSGNVPASVLTDELSDAISGRRVRAAVFTTFTFDPGFFELHVLPALFDQSFSQVDKVKRIQLEDTLREIDHLAVYYDQNALAQDGEPAQLDYRRIDVRRSTGCFHPKIIFLLVDNPASEEQEEDAPLLQSLIVAVLSANLTRSGWWENVECAHIEEIFDYELDESRYSFRSDLLSLIRRIRQSAYPGDDHTALDTINRFLRERTNRETFSNASSGGRFYTRIFSGQGGENLSSWLSSFRIGKRDWNLEVISPYFDPQSAGPLLELIEAIAPREIRAYLPKELDGSAGVSKATYEAITEMASWSEMPSPLVQRGGAENIPPRWVHAKVYRLWSRSGGDLLLVGSVNLTRAAHSHGGAGNLEAAFLIDVTEMNYPRRWWLTPSEREPSRFMEKNPTEEDGLETAPIGLSFRYDWGTKTLSYFLEDDAKEGFSVLETSGRPLFRIESPKRDKWVKCSADSAGQVQRGLTSSSFLLIKHPKGQWRLLVREENMGHRPSLLTQLTPEEILEYWALLTPEQRAAFIESHLGRESDLEGIPIARHSALKGRNTLFDRFAGIYHSFGCLQKHIEAAIDEGREQEAEARLLGAKYDSLPSFLEKSLEHSTKDPIISYVTFLCAKQIRDSLAKSHPNFLKEREDRSIKLDGLISELDTIRNSLPVDEIEGDHEFLEWYESAFLEDLGTHSPK